MAQQGTTIINGQTLNADTDISFAKPKVNRSGGKGVAVVHPGTSQWLHMSTPLMLTWGVNEFVDDASGKRSYDMSLQFPKEEYQTEITSQFLEAMQGFQDKLKSEAVKNAKAWFGKSKMSAEVVDALFHPMLRYPRDQSTGEPDTTRAPTLRIKLDYWDEAFSCEIYDIKQNASGTNKRLFPDEAGGMEGPGPMDLITKGSNVACILKCGGLWFANGKFGCTWKLMQAIVKPRASMRGTCMIKLSPQDQQTLSAQPTESEEADDTQDASAGVIVEDSDDEDDEDDDDGGNEDGGEVTAPPSFTAPAPPAPKAAAPKKRKVVRRKAGAGAR